MADSPASSTPQPLAHSGPYFFCGVGGSGMLPLALIVKARGADVEGSDRSLDAGRTAAKFEFLKSRGIKLHPQDGSGVTRKEQLLVTSAAVEDTVPDVVAAKQLGCPRVSRPQLLAELVNTAKVSIAVGGTSGKSTTTGMIGWILYATRRDPTVMNGAIMKNFVAGDAPFASAIVGEGDIFVSEVDESDGSIALYNPTIAVLNNIALDHKTMDELRRLFTDFISKAQVAVLNLDNDETRRLAEQVKHPNALTYSLTDTNADFSISDLVTQADGQSCIVTEKSTGERQRICLQTPGRHNLSNGLAAIAAARACGLGLREATTALMNFVGIRRRLEVVGTKQDITVIDDFGHNPDKISATLATLHAFPGRLLVMWQPHGYGPIRQMKDQFIEMFARDLAAKDVLFMPEPAYFGGTVDKSMGSNVIAEGVMAHGKQAYALPDRPACGDKLVEMAQPGDCIVIMGARDDTLSEFAADVLRRVGEKSF
ncbi:MAG TPA: Mur ligase family protein [Hyphomonadaceae bacterium]|nr:Mur ligase family protein [Hyphomonadaceae bacterium]